jgi:hypothetical protein
MTDENCDCGWAGIPQGASFCPGCGRPLTANARESERQANAFQRPRAEEEESGPLDRVTFGTPGALRSCYWSAAFAAIIMSLPYATLLCFIVYPGAGFYSVHSFRRQTRRRVTLRAGAKLGFLTGVITFALLLILMTIASTMPGTPGFSATLDELETTFQQQGDAEIAARIQKLRAEPTQLALMALIGLSIGFCVTTGFATAGGALGAKVLEDG